ncbi:hypothetical protein BKA63DRAFT_558890 [Paraphoma chrysanthemicola]|nr:hypothetical protein BKA63DRAFT_558890 [Paraphoma chrysanthemicola]
MATCYSIRSSKFAKPPTLPAVQISPHVRGACHDGHVAATDARFELAANFQCLTRNAGTSLRHTAPPAPNTPHKPLRFSVHRRILPPPPPIRVSLLPSASDDASLRPEFAMKEQVVDNSRIPLRRLRLYYHDRYLATFTPARPRRNEIDFISPSTALSPHVGHPTPRLSTASRVPPQPCSTSTHAHAHGATHMANHEAIFLRIDQHRVRVPPRIRPIAISLTLHRQPRPGVFRRPDVSLAHSTWSQSRGRWTPRPCTSTPSCRTAVPPQPQSAIFVVVTLMTKSTSTEAAMTVHASARCAQGGGDPQQVYISNGHGHGLFDPAIKRPNPPSSDTPQFGDTWRHLGVGPGWGQANEPRGPTRQNKRSTGARFTGFGLPTMFFGLVVDMLAPACPTSDTTMQPRICTTTINTTAGGD